MNVYSVILIALLCCVSCAKRIGGPLKEQMHSVDIEVAPHDGLGFLKPVGAYRVEGSDFFIYKYRPSVTNVSLILGFWATLASDGVQSIANSRLVEKHEQLLAKIQFNHVTQDLLRYQFLRQQLALRTQSKAKPPAKAFISSFGLIKHEEKHQESIVYVTDIDIWRNGRRLWRNQYQVDSRHNNVQSLVAGGELSLRQEIQMALSHNLKRFFADMENKSQIAVQKATSLRILYEPVSE